MRIRQLLCLLLCLVLLSALPACAGKSGEQPLPAPTAAVTSAAPEQGAAVPPEEDASGFVLLSEVVPDVILEMRYYSTYNFVGERIDGYEQPVALLTVQAAKALRAVSDEVAAMGYRLKVFDAYRPQTAVTQFMRWAQEADDTRMQAYFYPETEKSALFSQGYIAERSGHSRGSTVDLTLLELRTGREGDMGGTFDYFGARSHAEFSGISIPEDDMLLCRMTSLIDEDCGGEEDADALIEVATSGLPAVQVERLLRRREVMLGRPRELRRAASRRLSAMFRNGAWGPPEDARAAEEWKRVQTELAEAVKRAPEQPAEEMEKVFEKEKRFQDAGWVGFSDMNNGKEGK